MSVRVEHGDCLEALEVGKAAEHLVCADLILSGYRAFLTDQGLPYDVVIDVSGRLVRLQVKATAAPKPVPRRTHTPKYQWHVRRAGKGGKRIIGNNEFEILALVALDIRVVAYIPISDQVRQIVHLRPPGIGIAIVRTRAHVNRCVDEYPIQSALEELTW